MLKSEVGSDFLTVRLAIVLAAASMVMAAAATCTADLARSQSAAAARAEVRRIAEMSRLAYVESGPGDGGCFTVEASIPGCVRTAGFGAVPGGSGALTRCEHAYFIEYGDGRLETYTSDVPFASGTSSGALDAPAVLYPGKYKVCIKAETVNGRTMATIGLEAT